MLTNFIPSDSTFWVDLYHKNENCWEVPCFTGTREEYVELAKAGKKIPLTDRINKGGPGESRTPV